MLTEMVDLRVVIRAVDLVEKLVDARVVEWVGHGVVLTAVQLDFSQADEKAAKMAMTLVALMVVKMVARSAAY